jgi:hypothetical protein
MGRVYTAILEDFAITTAADILELAWPATKAGILLSIEYGQRTDYGDQMALAFDIILKRATGSGSGGGTVTPRPHSPSDTASGVVVETLNTSPATGLTVIRRIPFNAQAGYLYQPPVVEQYEIAPSGIIVLVLGTTLTSALTGSLNVTFMEIG